MNSETTLTNNMENLNGYSHDFLSNGIYQLYRDEHELDSAIDWSYYETTTSVTEGYTRIFEQLPSSDQHEDPKSYSIIGEYIVPDLEAHPIEYVTEHTSPTVTERNDDSWRPPPGCDEPHQNLNEDDWDLNIENILLDLDCTTSDWASQQLSLPDRTLFCNDSCDAFLRESSDGLMTNYFETSCPAGSSDRSSSVWYHSNEQNVIVYEVPSTPPESTSSGDAVHSGSSDEASSSTFPCTFGDCHKVYAKPAHLKAHLRRHVGDKPYICNWSGCTWKFSRSDELSRHRRSHSGVKPYKCGYCTKCFARSDHLTKHRKVHERKMAKLRGSGASAPTTWHQLPPGRPGRRPKAVAAAMAAANE